MGDIPFKKTITLIVILFLGLGQCIAQADSGQEPTSSLATLLGPENLLTVSQVQINLPTTNSNSIYIQQIGANNTISTNIHAENSELQLVQNGNSNSFAIDITARNVIHNTVQNGNNNFLMEYGNATNLNLERSIIQNGDNQGVVIFGSNALTNDIKLNIQGSSKTITIRNFN